MQLRHHNLFLLSLDFISKYRLTKKKEIYYHSLIILVLFVVLIGMLLYFFVRFLRYVFIYQCVALVELIEEKHCLKSLRCCRVRDIEISEWISCSGGVGSGRDVSN